MASSNEPPWARKSARPFPAKSRNAVSARVPSLANSAMAALSWVAAWAVGVPCAVRFARAAVIAPNSMPTAEAMGATLNTSLDNWEKSVLPNLTAVNNRSDACVAFMTSTP